MFILGGDVNKRRDCEMDPPRDVNLQWLRRARKLKRKYRELCSIFTKQSKMPKVKRSRKPPPDGWELIEPTLDELDQKMREGKPVEVKR